jgi:hypothetical protein
MSFFCPCLNWLHLTAGPERLVPDEQNDDIPVPQGDKRHYQGLTLSGDADSEPIHFSMLRSKDDSDNLSENGCKSPLMHLFLNTKNAISNKIQQGKDIATDSITMVYNNSSSEKDRIDGLIESRINDRIDTGYISDRNREAECVICLVEFSEGESLSFHNSD